MTRPTLEEIDLMAEKSVEYLSRDTAKTFDI